MSVATRPRRRSKRRPSQAHSEGTIAVVNEFQKIVVPTSVVDLASFREWLESDDIPEKTRICYLQGQVWVDMSGEQLYTHNQVKGEYSRVLSNHVKESRDGVFFPDGVRLTITTANISVGPDGVFASSATMQTGRVRQVEGKKGGFVELVGVPEMVMEMVSDSSEHKDKVFLHHAYWEAGITEYWLVDARQESPQFEIYRHTPKGYAAVRKQGGWIKSAVFGHSFQLLQQIHPLGHLELTLAMR